MPYNDNTGRIDSIPINTNIGGDIQKLLNTKYNGDLGYTIRLAGQNNRINKWSKYKPIIYANKWNTADELDSNTGAWSNTATWWQGPDGHCGFSIEHFFRLGTLSDTTSFIYRLTNDELRWDYDVLNGTNLEPFRILDLVQYEKNAIAPIWNVTTEFTETRNNDLRITYNYRPDASADAYSLRISDIKGDGVTSLADYYFGMAFKSGSTCYVATNSSVYSVTGAEVEIPNAVNLVGTWSMVPFFSSVEISLRTPQNITGSFLSTDMPVVNVTIKSYSTSLLDLSIDATWSLLDVDGVITAINNTDESRTFPRGTVYLYETAHPDVSDPRASGNMLASVAISQVVVPASTTSSIPFTLSGKKIVYMEEYIYWVVFVPASGSDYNAFWSPVSTSPEL